MKRRRALLLTITVVFVLCAACGVWLYVQKQQYARNRALITALGSQDYNTALTLVNEGADPNTRFEPTPAPTLKLLLDQLLRRRDVPVNNSPTAFNMACGFSGLVTNFWDNHTTVVEENLPLLQAMLAHGANVHFQDYEGDTPLHEAVLSERLHTVEWLLKCGADINARNTTGVTPLMLAVSGKNGAITPLLLSHGANPNVQDTKGNTALHYIIFSPNAKLFLSELLAPHADLSLRNKEGQTPLEMASSYQRLDLVRLLKRGSPHPPPPSPND